MSAPLDPVKHGIREASDDNSTRFAVQDLILQGTRGKPGKCAIHFGDELSAKPGPLELIPAGGRVDIGFRRPSDEQPVGHRRRRMSSRADFHGSTSAGCDS